MVENIDFVTCEICGKTMGRVGPSHLTVHNMTFSQYKIQFPNSVTISKVSSEKTSYRSTTMKRKEYKKWSEKTKQSFKDKKKYFFILEILIQMACFIFKMVEIKTLTLQDFQKEML